MTAGLDPGAASAGGARTPRGPAALLVNSAAREGAEALDGARRGLVSAGLDLVDARLVERPDALPALVRDAVARGARRVVVGGGDGSLAAAAGALLGTGAELAILPLGTANDLARSVGIPRDLAAACEVAARGVARRVDVAFAGDRPFLNAASLGVSSALTRRLHGSALKRHAGGLAYAVAAAAEAPGVEPFRLVLEAEGCGRRELLALQVVAGNGRFHGGGRLVAPGASLRDGALDVYAIPAEGAGKAPDLLRLARYALLLGRGRHLELPGLVYLRCAAVRVEAEPAQELDADGELAGRTPAVIRVGGAIRVVRPARA
jgi:YegS/Rv2252/BmrU family lipid kinase